MKALQLNSNIARLVITILSGQLPEAEGQISFRMSARNT